MAMVKRLKALAQGTGAVAKKAHILIAIGATGSGKSTRCKMEVQSLASDPEHAAKRGRLMVWDWAREYDDLEPVKTMASLQKALSAPQFALRFLPSYDREVRAMQFDVFCRLAMATQNLAMLCEELSNVVQANGGAAGWTAALAEGRHRGLYVMGTSQRPALIDKTAMSQATKLYCGNLELPADVQVMSQMLIVPAADIQALGPWDYIERSRETKALRRGNLADGLPKIISPPPAPNAAKRGDLRQVRQ
jgi:hypothetical protein